MVAHTTQNIDDEFPVLVPFATNPVEWLRVWRPGQVISAKTQLFIEPRDRDQILTCDLLEQLQQLDLLVPYQVTARSVPKAEAEAHAPQTWEGDEPEL